MFGRCGVLAWEVALYRSHAWRVYGTPNCPSGTGQAFRDDQRDVVVGL